MDGTAQRARTPARPRIEVDKLFDRLPPHSPEAEMSLLGSIILDPRALVDVLDHVSSGDDFYSAAHATIFDVLREIADRNPETDLVELTDRLRDRAELEEVGGAEYLVRLAEGVPSAVNAPHYARLVADKSRLRRLIGAASEILYEAYHVGGDGPEDVREAIDRAESKVFEIAREEDKAAFANLAQLLQDEVDRIESVEGRLVSGLHTGFDDLDEKLSGLQPGEMIIVAARPSMGKCLAHDSEITLADGSVVTIEEVVRRQAGPIPTLRDDLKLDWATPSAFVDDGVKPVFEVRTRLGRRIVTTLTHPFLTIDGWIPLSDLGAGDRIAAPRRLEAFGAGDMRECEVKLLAYLISDGGLTGTNPRFTSSSPRIAADFAEAIAAFGSLHLRLSSTREWEAPSWRISADRSGVGAARLRFARQLKQAIESRGTTARAVAQHMMVSPATLTHWTSGATSPTGAQALKLSEFLEVAPDWLCPGGVDAMRMNQPNPLTRWLAELGLMGRGAAEKRIPAPVFRVRRELLALLLNRLFATDGWATTLKSGQAQLGYATVSERLARQVQHLLLRFGVIASLRQRWVKYRDARRVSWQLDITDARSIRAFADQIGIFSKEDRLHGGLQRSEEH
ncbi:MAG: DnaB-like helicase N-terminal domain-containing protein, partial [Phycisphaerales bacterium JB039]